MSAKDRQRRQARKKFPCLMMKTKGKCYWCSKDIVVSQAIIRAYPYRIKKEYIFWTDYQGEEHVALFATVDHIVPIRDGGTNDPENLVASCGPCNRDRTATQQQNLNCKRCNKPRRGGKRHCPACRKVLSQEYFENRTKKMQEAMQK